MDSIKEENLTEILKLEKEKDKKRKEIEGNQIQFVKKKKVRPPKSIFFESLESSITLPQDEVFQTESMMWKKKR